MTRIAPSIRAGLAAALLLCCGLAHADAAANAASAFGTLSQIFQAIDSGISTFTAGQPFLPLGKKIAVVLFMIVLTWGLTRNMALGKPMSQLMGDIIQPLVLLGVTMVALDQGLGLKIRDSVLGLADTIAAALGQTTDALEVRIMMGFAEAGFRIWDTEIQTGSSTTEDGSWWDAVRAAFDVGGAGFAIIFGLAVKFAAALLMLAAGAVGAGVIVVAKISIALALLLAPVLIPWGMWKPTEFLFTAWLRYLISSSMQVVVAFAVAMLLIGAVNQMAQLSTSFSAATSSIALSSALILFSVLCMYIMMQAPSMASGLVSGDGTMGMSKWTAPSAAASGGVGKTGGTALGAGSGLVQGIKSGLGLGGKGGGGAGAASALGGAALAAAGGAGGGPALGGAALAAAGGAAAAAASGTAAASGAPGSGSGGVSAAAGGGRARAASGAPARARARIRPAPAVAVPGAAAAASAAASPAAAPAPAASPAAAAAPAAAPAAAAATTP